MTLSRLSKTTQHPCKRSKIDSRIAALMAGGKVAVDIGCGIGYGLDEISKFYEIAVGIDVNTTRLKQRATLPYRWHFVLANLNEQFPLKNDYVDLVFANQVIEHIADPRFLSSEIFRILKQAGFAIITSPNIRFVKHLKPCKIYAGSIITGITCEEILFWQYPTHCKEIEHETKKGKALCRLLEQHSSTLYGGKV